MGDLLTVLRSAHLHMCKVWKADGTIEPYSTAKWFDARQADVADVHGLSRLLTDLETDPHACIIRGTPKEGVDLRAVRRLIDNFEDLPLHTMLVEIDGYRPAACDPLYDPEGSALEYVAECLPPAFQGASFHWQLSNSAGAPGKEGYFKAHLWFWLTTPQTSAVLRAWAKAEELQLDRAVLQIVQVHYTATPIFEDGATDPAPVRSGFFQGARDDVPLEIDPSVLDVRLQGVRQRGERVEGLEDNVADWIEANWETWGYLPNGGIVVSCPFEDKHTNSRVDGDTSTVYFPAGTNGYADGAWVCLHNHCRDKPKSEFSGAAGYTSNLLAALAQPMPEPEPPLASSAMVLDGEMLPPFQRDGKGFIYATVDNLSKALVRHDMTGMVLRKDLFREEIVWSPPGRDAWRPFTDTDYTELRLRLERQAFKPIGREVMRDMVHYTAMLNAFDTAADWLGSLEWDGVPRIDRFWIDHFGVVNDNYGYAMAVGAYTWTALAGRALTPGIQADMAPILVGPQGVGKSRGIQALAPAPTFATTMSFTEPEVERTRKMRGTLIVELAELNGLRTREREEIKAWITRSDEHWTPKFMEMSTKFRRRCLFLGSTNDEDGFLDDPTGERRWLPMSVGKREGFTGVDVEGIVAVRKQLWAEGRDRFLANGIEWQAAQQLAPNEHQRYRSEDVWQEAVTQWLDRPDMAGHTPRQREYLTAATIAQGALGIELRHVKRDDRTKIGKIMRQEGYERAVRRPKGGKPVNAFWAPDFC